jgi:metal-sulfur cluster biosynthetic enzyme
MSAALKDRILTTLDTVRDPCSIANRHPMGIVELGLLIELDVNDSGDVHVLLRPTSPSCTLIGSIMRAVDEQIGKVDGVRSVSVDMDASNEWTPDRMTTAGKDKLDAMRAETLRQLKITPPGARTRQLAAV